MDINEYVMEHVALIDPRFYGCLTFHILFLIWSFGYTQLTRK